MKNTGVSDRLALGEELAITTPAAEGGHNKQLADPQFSSRLMDCLLGCEIISAAADTAP